MSLVYNKVAKTIIGNGSTAIWSDSVVFEGGKPFAISVQGTFTSGTIRLQKSYDLGVTWYDADIVNGVWSTVVETQSDNPAGSVQWRIGCTVGDAFTGNVVARLIQQ